MCKNAEVQTDPVCFSSRVEQSAAVALLPQPSCKPDDIAEVEVDSVFAGIDAVPGDSTIKVPIVHLDDVPPPSDWKNAFYYANNCNETGLCVVANNGDVSWSSVKISREGVCDSDSP